jgi:hypothetical protein
LAERGEGVEAKKVGCKRNRKGPMQMFQPNSKRYSERAGK